MEITGVLMWLLIAGGSVGFWGTVLYLGFRLVRAAERRSLDHTALGELRTRVAQLEKDLEATRSETVRLGSAETHMMMLLSRKSQSERTP